MFVLLPLVVMVGDLEETRQAGIHRGSLGRRQSLDLRGRLLRNNENFKVKVKLMPILASEAYIGLPSISSPL